MSAGTTCYGKRRCQLPSARNNTTALLVVARIPYLPTLQTHLGTAYIRSTTLTERFLNFLNGNGNSGIAMANYRILYCRYSIRRNRSPYRKEPIFLVATLTQLLQFIQTATTTNHNKMICGSTPANFLISLNRPPHNAWLS